VCSDIGDLDLKERYDVILMDPPWENKHVKRKRNSSLGYNMLPNSQIQVQAHLLRSDKILRLGEEGVRLVVIHAKILCEKHYGTKRILRKRGEHLCNDDKPVVGVAALVTNILVTMTSQ
jgi:hypothetical protein